MDEKRQEELSRALEEIVNDGERFVVECSEGLVDVQPIEDDQRPISEEKPELYGQLLSVSEILSDAGSNVVLFSMLTVAGICLVVYMEWVDNLFGLVDVDKVNSPWVYVFVLVGCFFLSGQVALWIEAWAYRRYRGQVIRAVREAGLSRWNLLARISKDEDLSNIVDKLKVDRRDWDSGEFEY